MSHVGYANGRFAGVTSKGVALLYDGGTLGEWTRVTIGPGLGSGAFGAGDGRFLLISGGLAWSSADGVTWQSAKLSTRWPDGDLVRGNGVWLGSMGGVPATSPDGVAWTKGALPAGAGRASAFGFGPLPGRR